MDDLKFFLGIAFKVVLPIFLVAFLLVYCINSCYHETEDSPSPSPFVEIKDIQYKGHTYISVDATYSHTLVHAEHCKCHTVKK